jgi:hypothetical protein
MATLAKVGTLDKLVSKITARAARRAIDRALVSTRKRVSELIRSQLNIRAKAVNELVVINKAFGGEDGKLQGTLEIRDRPFRLVEFQPRVKRISTSKGMRTGVTVKVKQTRKLVQGGFLATMPSGHEGIFKRKGAGQYPIVELFTTRPTDLLEEGGNFLKETQTFAEERFKLEYEREFNYQINRELEP